MLADRWASAFTRRRKLTADCPPICATSLTAHPIEGSHQRSCRPTDRQFGSGPERMYLPSSSWSMLPPSASWSAPRYKAGSVGVAHNLRNLDRKHFAAGDASDRGLVLPRSRATPYNGGHPRLAGPRRLKLRTEGPASAGQPRTRSAIDPVTRARSNHSQARLNRRARPLLRKSSTVRQVYRESARASVAGCPVWGG